MTKPSPQASLMSVRGTELLASDSRERYRQKLARITLDSMVQFVGLLDTRGTVLDINRVALDAVGIKLSDIEGKPFWTTLWWQVSEKTNRVLRESIVRASRGEFVRWDAEIYGGAGGEETIIIDASLTPVKDEHGNVVFITVEGRDISERKVPDREIARQREEPAQLDRLRHEAAEKELQLTAQAESERQRLHDLLTAAQIGTWEWDPSGNIQLLSPELHRIFGTDATDPDYVQAWASCVYPDDWPKVQQEMAEAQRTGDLDFEYRYQHPEKGLRWFYCKGSRSQGSTAMLGIVQDITDRRMAEESMRRSEERFRAIVDTTPECVKVVAHDGTLLHMNSAGLNLIGAESLSLVAGENVYDLVAQEDRDRFRKFNERVCEGDRDSLEFDIVGLQGIRRHMETHAAPLRSADGSIVQLAVTRDITERRRAQEVAERLSAIISSSDDAIVSKDLNGIVTSWNAAAERIMGYTAEEMIGKPITTIIPPELHDDEIRILRTIARGDRIEHFETVRVTKSGERIDVSLTVSPMKDASGKIVGAAKIARDITQRKKAERALHTAERLASVGRMAATVAHEINNPLEALTNLLYLARNSDVPSEIKEYLAAAEEELDRVSHLTKQTLGFYRETKGSSTIRVGSLVASLLSVFSSRTRNRGIEVRAEIDEDPEICAVPGELRQLIANLISNSIDAVGGGGQIRVRVSGAMDWKQNRKGVRLTVADNGAGISNELRVQLFEPFFTTKKDVGTGLGLWVCKSIVEKHQGAIRVKSSTTPAKSWTAFSVFLPLHAEITIAGEALRKAG